MNKSAILHSYYNNEEDPERKELIFTLISQLDVMSRLAIDFAKKQFSVNWKACLKKIDSYGIVERVDNKPVLPLFMQKVVKNKEGRIFNRLNTSMDYVYEYVDNIKKAKRTKRIEIVELLKKPSQLEGSRNKNRIETVKCIFEDYQKKLAFNSINGNSSNAKKECVEALRNMEISEKDILAIVKITKPSELIILYEVFKDKVLKVFNKK